MDGPWAAPAFRQFFAASTISRWGDTFNTVALVVVVYRLTGSGLQVATTVALEVAPVLALGFVAGAVVDRLPRRTVLVLCDLGRAAVALALAAGHEHLWLVYVAAFSLSALSVFFAPAAASTLPTLVEDRALVAANGALWSAAVVSQIALAPLAGGLVATLGAGPAFAINAGSFVLSGAVLSRLPSRGRRTPAGSPGLVSDGVRHVRGDRLLSVLAGAQALAALSAGATSALLVVLAARRLDAGAGRFGVLLAAIGVGAALGPFLLRRLVVDPARPTFVFAPYLLRGLVDLVLAATTSFAVALTALGLYGVGTSTGMVTYTSLLQRTVPDQVRGRVFAFFDMVWQAGRLVSLCFGGVLADRAGIPVVYALGGLLLLGAGAGGLLLARPASASADRRAARRGPRATGVARPPSSAPGSAGTDGRHASDANAGGGSGDATQPSDDPAAACPDEPE